MVTTTAAAAPYTVGAAIQLAVSGIAIVLIALAMLGVLVVLLGKVLGSVSSKPAPKAAPAPAPVAPVQATTPAVPAGMTVLSENQSRGELNLFEVDDKTAALIMAIIADATETPLNQLYFRSIREVK